MIFTDILQEFNAGDLYTRYAVEENPDDRDFTMHVHEYCEIFYFVSGEAAYLVEGSRYLLQSGDIMIMRPAESHRTKILDRSRYERYVINFSPAMIDNIDPQRRLLKAFFDRPLGRGNLYSSPELDKIRLKTVFHDACCCDRDDYGRRVKVLTNLFMLLDAINDACLRRGKAEDMPLRSPSEQMVDYVNMHLFEELSVPMLAKQFFLSPSQFSRNFKHATGAAPWEYITIKRLTAAREKIRGGESAQSAGEDCGFGDYSAFYRAYLKFFGCSPKNDR